MTAPPNLLTMLHDALIYALGILAFFLVIAPAWMALAVLVGA